MRNKILMMLLALTISLSIFASEPVWAKTTSMSIKYSGGEWSRWTNQSIDVCMDFDRNQIIIYSQEIQIFDWVSVDSYRKAPFDVLEMHSTDTKYRKCIVRTLMSDTSLFIYIEYDDVMYGYKLK